MQWLRGRGRGNSEQDGTEPQQGSQRPSRDPAPPRPGARASRANRSTDPFGIHGKLFEYLTHVEQDGEAFVGYRTKGNPMVLLSQVDGAALASIHILMVGDRSRALLARRPGSSTAFQGVLTAEGQAFELVLMNLTTDAVLMMDIGGEIRTIEPQYWDRTDKEFWTGKHRNDHRMNRSNILWPMTPNICEENNIHYQETGVSRRLQLLTQASLGADSDSGQGAQAADFPLFVYPKYNSRAARRFERTVWSCPETIVVIGSPQLLGESSEGYNIQRDNPLNRHARRRGDDAPAQGGVVGALADTLGVTSARLLEVVQVEAEFLAELPDEMVHEVLMHALNEDKMKTLLEEGADDAPQHGSSVSSMTSAGPAAASSTGPAESAVDGATPAAVVAGERMLRLGGHNLLIEKFDFRQCSQAATLGFGVFERLQTSDEAIPEDEARMLREDVHRKIQQLCSGRREVLLEQISSVYQTPECVICMGERPDTVLYQCGHRCVHFKCVEKAGLRRCPLCRAPIAAMLPDSSLTDTTTSV